MNRLANNLELLKSDNQLMELSKFIVFENFNHHTNGELSIDCKDDINSIYFEERKYFSNSKIYMSKDEFGNINGSIRTLEWNYIDTLPIQKMFDINPLNFMNDSNSKVWHIGRFAIRKDIKDRNLFKRLMVCAIHPICQNKGSVVFAECDSKLLRVLNLLGITTEVIGESIDYLGSETIPVAMTTDGLLPFYSTNNNLVPFHLLENHFQLFRPNLNYISQ